MSNPVFNSSGIFSEPRRGHGRGAVVQAPQAPYGQAPYGQAPYGQAPYGQAPYGQVPGGPSLEEMYAGPTATTRETGRLTYDDVIIKTGGLLALLVVVAAATYTIEPLRNLWFIGAIVGFVLALVNSFKRTPSPALITLYAVAEGVFLGGISYIIPLMFDVPQAIVTQAVLATFATTAAALALFKSGRVRVTPKFTRWLIIAMVGYLVFSLANFALSFFLPSDGFGPLREGGMGIVVGLIAVGLAAASLIMDFDAIQRGVRQGAPKQYAWTAAFGLIVTLVWLYFEFLRLLAIFNRD